jgi:2-phosphosulfolactate phosphatase
LLSPSGCFTQTEYGVRFDRGPTGARTLTPGRACLVVVDVLSFTTSVTVAVEAGTRVFPYPSRDITPPPCSPRRSAQHWPCLADWRRRSRRGRCRRQRCAALRSPNVSRCRGSTIAATANGVPVIAGCLRNATAIGRWLAQQGWATPAHPVTVIAAGERWPDKTLRPAIEDLLGAGAIATALHERGGGPLSPEATTAHACFQATAEVASAVATCAPAWNCAATASPKTSPSPPNSTPATPLRCSTAERPPPPGGTSRALASMSRVDNYPAEPDRSPGSTWIFRP